MTTMSPAMASCPKRRCQVSPSCYFSQAATEAEKEVLLGSHSSHKNILTVTSYTCKYTRDDKMIAATKIAVLLLVAIIALAMSAQGRELLDYYDDCYNRESYYLNIFREHCCTQSTLVSSIVQSCDYAWPNDPRGSSGCWAEGACLFCTPSGRADNLY